MKSDTLRPELKEKIVEWLISFHRLDPRYKILTFFNQVASDGADNFVEDDEDYEFGGGEPQREYTRLENLLRQSLNTSSILTVWRPTSNEAMRKMMEQSGVGKGLDIKGKSAQTGELSAFVPFLQIHDNEHKAHTQPISHYAQMRVYYSSSEARQKVMDYLAPLSNDSTETDETKVIPGDIKELDNYVDKQLWGIQLHQRLFWLGCVEQQDITREEDTETGRPSMPGFQDANLKTLKLATSAQPKPDPMPVVFQYDKNPEHALLPQRLVMAYEENGTVIPVVSDFDGFLLGWRREALWFGCQLPRDQEDLMVWAVDHIEQILDSKPNTDTWTVRWLEVLKKESDKMATLEIPQYGFGDPKSYGIMERAAEQMIDTGAVRHGSECFNYYFPQEIDDYFLVISDTFQPVPWKYCNVEELQQILSQSIQDGFVFPLNPKWILCDPGWKKLYDELMASDALYADYTKDVWYPPFSGVREKIERIYKKHPKGFKRARGRTSFIASKGYSPLRQNLDMGTELSGNAAFDLAELEFEAFKTSKNSRKNDLAEQIRASMEELPEVEDENDGEQKTSKDTGAANKDREIPKNSGHSMVSLRDMKTEKLLRKSSLAEQVRRASMDDSDHINSNDKNDANNDNGKGGPGFRGVVTRA